MMKNELRDKKQIIIDLITQRDIDLDSVRDDALTYNELADQIITLLPQWISVESPPEILGRAYWVHNKFGEHEAWFINNDFFLRSGMIPIEGVTHWMPLPQLPKED